MALGLYPDGGSDPARFDAMLDEIAQVGASHVALVVTWAQDHIGSIDIAPGHETIDDATLVHAIEHAHALGLQVMVFPILTVRELSPGQWRGTIEPRDVDAWWLAYEAFITHYARIAAKTRSRALLIGSELSSTEAWMYRWYHLISGVQRIYDGALVYSANWDHYQHVSFWRRLDVIGITGYFDLTRDNDADLTQLANAWRQERARILEYMRSTNKALWLTEVGYTSVDGTATRPWDYQREGRTDHEEQRRAYAAFVDAWDGVPELDGVFFWNWYGRGGKMDRGYTPKGKPAEAVLRAWYRGQAAQ